MPFPEGDIPLPIIDDDLTHEAVANPWALPQQQPTTLIALWPGSQAPTETEVIAALSQAAGTPLRHVDELPHPDILWSGVYKSALLASPMIIWAEPAKPLSPDELDDPQALACRWIVGFESMLDPARPHDEYVSLLRAVAAAVGSPAILDPITHRWFTRTDLEDLTHSPPSQPPAEVLWTIHAVWPEGADDDRPVWLHTHGLWRCGRPELEMLEVPDAHQAHAAHLLNEIAAFSLDDQLAGPGEPVAIGSDLEVTFHPWTAIAPQVTDRGCGGVDDRQGQDNPHAGVRAVICGRQPRGAFRKQWAWPREAVEKLANDDAVIYRSTAATERAAALARANWSELATAFASLPRELLSKPSGSQSSPASPAAQVVMLVKAAVAADDGDPDHREHLWFHIRRFHGFDVEAELINQPLLVTSMRKGDAITVRNPDVSDWIVYTPHGRFGPDAVPALWRAIATIKGGGQ